MHLLANLPAWPVPFSEGWAQGSKLVTKGKSGSLLGGWPRHIDGVWGLPRGTQSISRWRGAGGCVASRWSPRILCGQWGREAALGGAPRALDGEGEYGGRACPPVGLHTQREQWGASSPAARRGACRSCRRAARLTACGNGRFLEARNLGGSLWRQSGCGSEGQGEPRQAQI